MRRSSMASSRFRVETVFVPFSPTSAASYSFSRKMSPGRLDQAVAPERLDLLRAQPLDVEGVAADEVLEALDRLGRADQAAGAAPDRLALRLFGVGAALRTGRREPILGAVGRTLLQDHPHDLRDDVAGALDHHGVADADVLAPDLALVVQGGVRDRDAADLDRLQPGDRGEGAGAADLDLNCLQHRLGLLGLEFVGDRPARRPADHAEALLPVQAVDLVDDAVDVVGQG